MLSLIVIIIIIIGGLYFYHKSKKTSSLPIDNSVISNALNTTYAVDGESFELVNGVAEHEIAPGSATKNTLTVYDKPMYGDLDNDGDDDAVVILVNNPGGSGSFYYAAIAVNSDGIYKGTDTILLGDRITPQKIQITNDKAVINYLTRSSEQDFSVEPSVEKSLSLKFDPSTLKLIQVETNFEGEANPEIMTLDMKPWTWIKTTYSNDTEITPKKTDAFTLTFKKGGSVSATTDCNAMNATYTINDKTIKFGPITSTKMFCKDSQEQEFAKMLSAIHSYFFTSKGELVFDLKLDSGTATFR